MDDYNDLPDDPLDHPEGCECNGCKFYTRHLLNMPPKRELPTYIHMFTHADWRVTINGVLYRVLKQENAGDVTYCCLERVNNDHVPTREE